MEGLNYKLLYKVKVKVCLGNESKNECNTWGGNDQKRFNHEKRTVQ